MKRRTAFYIIVFILLGILGIYLGLVFHEMGHAIMAIVFKIPIRDFKIGLLSYVEMNVSQATNFQLAMVAIGSILIPEVIYLILMISKKWYISLEMLFSGMLLYANIIASIPIVIIGSKIPQNWDMLMFQKYSNWPSISIMLLLMAILILNIVLEIKFKRIQAAFIYFADKF